MHPAPVGTWDAAFADTVPWSDEDSFWNSLVFTYTSAAGLGADGGGIVIKGDGGLIVGVSPPPISPWKP